MPYTERDVGPAMAGGVAVPLSLAERTATSDRWNDNEAKQISDETASANRSARATALRVSMDPDLIEYLDLKGI